MGHAFRTLPGSTAVLLACALAGGLTACKPDAAIKKSEVIGRGSKMDAKPPANEPQNVNEPPPNLSPSETSPAAGSIMGIVSFNGTPPRRLRIDTTMDPACSLGNAAPVLAEQYVVNGGKLANVFVYLKSGPASAMQAGPAPAQPVVLDQKNCQYVPHVIGVMQGGYVEFHNSDPTMHNIHTMPTTVGNQTIDISQGPRGAAVTKQFEKPELMMPVRCNNHPWMNAFINVSATPFFAVSDANGHFEIRGLPPGTYTVAAVHEKLGERDATVIVPPNRAGAANFSFAAQ